MATQPRPQPQLRADDLLLRAFVADDAEQVQLLAGDERIADSTVSIPHPYSLEQASKWIAETAANWAADTDANFAITLIETGELIGAISLMHVDDSEAELGYWAGVPWWGRGIATCAARALLEFGFSQMQLRRIHARCLSRNPASGKVLLRSGFNYLRTEESICGYQGENQATDFFECLTP